MSSRRAISATAGAVFAAALIALAGIGEATAQSASCARLEAELARAHQGGNAGNAAKRQKWSRASRQQDAALKKTQSYAHRQGCSGAKRGTPLCQGLTKKIGRMQANLRKLNAGVRKFSGGGSSNTSKIRSIKARMRRMRCGEQVRVREARYEARSERRSNGLFGMLFRDRPRDRSMAEYRRYDFHDGRRDSYRDERALPTSARQEWPDDRAYDDGGFSDDVNVYGSTFRTLCVRTCDGYYFPISFSTGKRNFYRDKLVCQKMCPDAEVELFVHRNPGEESEDMTTVSGVPYAEKDYAFAYRQAFNSSCSCGRVTPSMTPISTSGLTSPVTVAGETALLSDDDALKSGTIRVKLPVPEDKPALGEDPDTLANLRGQFMPLATANPSSLIASAAKPSERKVRRVGPAFFPAQ
ncbi:MAG: hypothetical protein C0606_01275 [Hyphomicrobiales bacterium]|nr:MAG: hypothetical protein C0606_01275 [Hyphomicrobiales bacterium]